MADIIHLSYEPLRFEYDQRKSDSNEAKHGIDFEEAQRLWDDEPQSDHGLHGRMSRNAKR